MFAETFVVTCRAVRARHATHLGLKFRVVRIGSIERVRTTELIWRGAERVHVSGPERTILDGLNDPTWLGGWRHLEVSDQRTAVDWAYQIRDLVDVHYPEAERITLVMDNLNTHTPASLYKAFTPQEARRILERLEIHYTPKHGSWLKMAEIEFSVLSKQCLDRRIADQPTLQREVSAWVAQRNAHKASRQWRCTTEDARIKLKRLYPTIDH